MSQGKEMKKTDENYCVIWSLIIAFLLATPPVIHAEGIIVNIERYFE